MQNVQMRFMEIFTNVMKSM